MGPLFFEPFLREQIWGGRQLASVLGKPLPPEGLFGESWEISAHPLHVSRVKAGQLAGWLLTELWSAFKSEMWGEAGDPPEEFPWLIKFLDCQDYLSIQVHPDDELAALLCPPEKGKFEVWTVIGASPESTIFLGVKHGIGPNELRAKLEQGEPEACLNVIKPRVGDVLIMGPGTVHSAGGGVLVAEVQTSSDATFRLYDWNRRDKHGSPRPLHMSEALRAINWESEKWGLAQPLQKANTNGIIEELWVSSPPFTLRTWTIPARRAFSLVKRTLGAWMVLWGSGNLTHDGGITPVKRGDTFLVPASCSEIQWETTSSGRAVLLSCHAR